MKSQVTQLYDYRQMEIPEELCRWHIADEEIRESLEAMGRSRAQETEPDTVERFDSVACQGQSEIARWNRPALRFYPGRGLCDEALESALLGAQVGEARTVRTAEGPVTLTVTRIVRRSGAPVNDALVKAEGIDGVDTVADYCLWYRRKREAERREEAATRIAFLLMRESVEKSVLDIDEAERNDWVGSYVDAVYDSLTAAGMDPRIPEDGTEFLSEEQAKANMRTTYGPAFGQYIVQRDLVQDMSGRDADVLLEEGLAELAAKKGVSVKQLLEESWAASQAQVMTLKAMELLTAYAQQFLED